MTIQQAVDAFLIDQQVRGNSPHTLRYYRDTLGRFSAFLGPNQDVTVLTLSRLKEYALWLSDGQRTTVTVQTYIRGVRSFLSWLYMEEYHPVNLSERFRLPKARRQLIDILTDD